MKNHIRVIKFLLTLVLGLSLILTTFITEQVFAADERYVLIDTVDVATEGYSYSDREKMLRDYYDNEIARGMMFDYDWLIEDGRHYYYQQHQYDGKIYPPHDIITEDLTVLYTKPTGIAPSSTIKIPYSIGWKGVNKEATGYLANFQIIVFAGDDQANQQQVGGELYYLSDSDELTGEFQYKLNYNYKYITIYVFSGFSNAGGLGKGYAYELQSMPQATSTTAAPTKANVVIDGNKVAFEAYNIGGNNYFKLRDLAMAINSTEKNFEVGWDSANNAIKLTSGKAYTPVGGELKVSASLTNKSAVSTASKIYLDGKEIALTAYNINGNNYFKLRDIGKVIDFGVTWNGVTSTIDIDTSVKYTE